MTEQGDDRRRFRVLPEPVPMEDAVETVDTTARRLPRSRRTRPLLRDVAWP